MTRFNKDNAIPIEDALQFILLLMIVLIPAMGNYFELMNESVRNIKIQELGILWVLGHAGFSIAVMAIGLYLIFNNTLRNFLFGGKYSDPS